MKVRSNLSTQALNQPRRKKKKKGPYMPGRMTDKTALNAIHTIALVVKGERDASPYGNHVPFLSERIMVVALARPKNRNLGGACSTTLIHTISKRLAPNEELWKVAQRNIKKELLRDLLVAQKAWKPKDLFRAVASACIELKMEVPKWAKRYVPRGSKPKPAPVPDLPVDQLSDDQYDYNQSPYERLKINRPQPTTVAKRSLQPTTVARIEGEPRGFSYTYEPEHWDAILQARNLVLRDLDRARRHRGGRPLLHCERHIIIDARARHLAMKHHILMDDVVRIMRRLCDPEYADVTPSFIPAESISS